MIRPDAVYTENEAVAALGLESLKAFREFDAKPVGGILRTRDEAGDFHLGVDLIAAVYRRRGEEAPEFASVICVDNKRYPQDSAGPPAEPVRTIHPMQTFSVKEISEFIGRSQHHVLNLIRSGELEASNVALKNANKPTYRISNDAYLAFLRMRSTRPNEKPRRRRRTDPAIEEFY